MTRHIILPDVGQRRLVFYLAMEEYVADNIGEGFFLWQVPPTVIFGRNQDMAAEVNIPFCEENGIAMFRRKSGGGCVYSDWGNLMISYITRGTNVENVFSAYLEKLASCLSGLGLDIATTHNNDVLIGGRKVSGNAFFKRPSSSIVHGTLLYNTDFTQLSKAITPSQEKLQSHGVKSVRQRVANLVDIGLDMSLEDLKSYLIAHFSDSEYVLTPEEVANIEEIEKTYLDFSFIIGKNH